MYILLGPFNPFLPYGNDLLFVFLCDKFYFVSVFDAIFDFAAVFLKLQPRLSTLPHKLVLVEISFGVFNHFLPFLSMQRGQDIFYFQRTLIRLLPLFVCFH